MPVRNRRASALSLAASLLAFSSPVALHAAERRGIDVAGGPLDRAIAVLARQAGVDIGSAETGVGQVVARRVHGRLTAAAALDRLLAGTRFMARRVDATSFRIVRRPTSPARPKPPRRPMPSPSASAGESTPRDIVVTATKRDTSRLRFPGAVTILGRSGALAFGDDAASGMDQAIAATPILQGTALGAGRNKLFVRGIADSSFAGPTQSTANVYFGEVPVAYNGADPGLNLYDMERVEVLEGPQGTLYGAGAIGGIVRLVPHPVDPAHVEASVSGGVSLTKSGAPGSDIAAMVNLPIVTDMLGVRVVGYRVAEGGYIDDVRRGRRDVNQATTTGGRIDLRATPGDGWTIDTGLLAQNVSARDLQYAERGLAPLQRAAALAQPFDQHYLLGRVVVDKRWDDGLHLVSASGLVGRDADSRFDATRPARPNAPIAYDTHERSRLLSHETRLSRTGANGAGWLVGLAVIRARDAYARTYGPPNRLRDIVGVTNRTHDAALFGELGVALAPAVTVTMGGRVTRQRTDGDPIASLRVDNFIRGRSVTRFDPTLGVSWLVAPGLAAYARYQSGFRTGGITVAPGVGRVADLLPDTLRVGEIGVRKDRRGPTGIGGSIGLSLTHWRDIQADLVDRNGFPYTANVGNSHIRALEATADWVPMAGLRFDAAMFLNDTHISYPAAGVDFTARRTRLPNASPFSLAANVAYRWSIAGRSGAGVDGGWRYDGRSVVGTQAPLDVSQGRYGTTHVGGHVDVRSVRVTMAIDNVFDVRGDRFAVSNPFALAARNEYTPLRPRSIRVGGSISW